MRYEKDEKRDNFTSLGLREKFRGKNSNKPSKKFFFLLLTEILTKLATKREENYVSI